MTKEKNLPLQKLTVELAFLLVACLLDERPHSALWRELLLLWWAMVFIVSSNRTKRIFGGRSSTRLLTGIRHSGHWRNFLVATISSRQRRQKVCWHGRTRLVPSKTSMHTEHSRISYSVFWSIASTTRYQEPKLLKRHGRSQEQSGSGERYERYNTQLLPPLPPQDSIRQVSSFKCVRDTGIRFLRRYSTDKCHFISIKQSEI